MTVKYFSKDGFEFFLFNQDNFIFSFFLHDSPWLLLSFWVSVKLWWAGTAFALDEHLSKIVEIVGVILCKECNGFTGFTRSTLDFVD